MYVVLDTSDPVLDSRLNQNQSVQRIRIIVTPSRSTPLSSAR
jgi:riboflavin biosynthesis pyrimidine reductase